MAYTVTVRVDGDKVARQVRVESDTATIADVIEQALHERHIDRMLADFNRNHRGVALKDFWTVIPQRSIPPKPEPLDFDALVDQHSI